METEGVNVPHIVVDCPAYIVRTRDIAAPCERLFSYTGLTISNDRNRLLPENAEEFIFLRVAWSKVDTLKRKREVT